MKNYDFKIFSENKYNLRPIENLYDSVFGKNRNERTVYNLRTGKKMGDLCFVIKKTDTNIFACIRYWLIEIGFEKGLLLGPLAVRKDMQRHGLGSMLIKHSLEIAKEKKFKFCFVSGESDYYPKFGFNRINQKNLILPGTIDPERLHIIFFEEGIENKMGDKPWTVKSSY